MNLFNATFETTEFENSTNLTTVESPGSRPATKPAFGWLLTTFYILGIFGNFAAIIALRRGERRMRNRKHLLMLTALAANDLVALLGMMAAMMTSAKWPWVVGTRWFCAIRVVLRVFGIGSVGITVVMSLERWLALTRPFLYQKQVTYQLIRTALLVSWGWAAFLTCLPLAGLGVYYEDSGAGKCTRYREAESTVDVAYAVFYVVFGTFLCAVLVHCNLLVIKALYSISAPNSEGRLTVRRITKTSSKRETSTRHQPCLNTATIEEVAFSRLMATLSVLFMICWLPQMITSTLYLATDESEWPRLEILSRVSDLLMLLNYVLDPYLYVLLRRNRYNLKRCLADICSRSRFWQSRKTSQESMKSWCPQETLLTTTTDNTGSSELKNLNAKSATTEQPGGSEITGDLVML